MHIHTYVLILFNFLSFYLKDLPQAFCKHALQFCDSVPLVFGQASESSHLCSHSDLVNIEIFSVVAVVAVIMFAVVCVVAVIALVLVVFAVVVVVVVFVVVAVVVVVVVVVVAVSFTVVSNGTAKIHQLVRWMKINWTQPAL